jgi:hypothetical protein
MSDVGNYARNNVQSIVHSVGSSLVDFYLVSNESELTRDVYGSIVSNTVEPINITCFPIRMNPTQKILEKVGMTEVLDILFYVSVKELQQRDIDFDKFDLIRSKIVYKNTEYVIKEKNYYSQYGDEFLYLVIGGHKK